MGRGKCAKIFFLRSIWRERKLIYGKGIIMSNEDVCFLRDGIRFNFRVSCMIRKGNQVLLHRKEKDTFWNLIGGRVALGESSVDAVRREIKEELGCDSKIHGLVRVCENFFPFNGETYHEMLMIFSGELMEEIQQEKIEDGIVVKWFAVDELEHVDVRPEFTKKMLVENEREMGWLVNDELRGER